MLILGIPPVPVEPCTFCSTSFLDPSMTVAWCREPAEDLFITEDQSPWLRPTDAWQAPGASLAPPVCFVPHLAESVQSPDFAQSAVPYTCPMPQPPDAPSSHTCILTPPNQRIRHLWASYTCFSSIIMRVISTFHARHHSSVWNIAFSTTWQKPWLQTHIF